MSYGFPYISTQEMQSCHHVVNMLQTYPALISIAVGLGRVTGILHFNHSKYQGKVGKQCTGISSVEYYIHIPFLLLVHHQY